MKILFDPKDEFSIKEDTRLAIRDKEEGKFIHTQVIKKNETYNFDTALLKSHWNYRYKYQVRSIDPATGNLRWSDITDYKRLYPERRSKSGLKYLLYKKTKSTKLLVVFQAINKNPTYNYVGLLRDTNIHQLYIKDDYGQESLTRTSYYLNLNTKFDVEDSIVKLITKVLNEVNLTINDVIFAGSSKGGFASLYYAYKLGAGHVVAGGPQVLLGNYLSKGHEESSVGKNIFKTMFGEINNQNIDTANNILPNILKNTKFKDVDVNIHVGYWEPHFEEHIQPFMNYAKKNKLENISVHTNDYNTHSGLATYFPPYLVSTINTIINK